MTALCSGKICTIFPEKGALNFWKACTIALEYSYIIKNLNTTKMDKDLSISGMSRSLSLYFGLLMVFSFLTIFIKPTCLTIISPLIYGIISSLLYLRYLRFTKLRYTNIFRTFLYNFFE